MNDADIVKALNHCTRLRPCEKCPLYKEGYFGPSRNACRAKLMEGAFGLINRQQAEIERLKEKVKGFQELWCEAESDLRTARAEAIKEFAERLCEGRVSNDPVVISAKCLVKEMTEGEKNG